MKAKDFMEQVEKAEKQLILISEQKRHLMDVATSIGVNLTGMPGKQRGSSRVENVVTIVDLANELIEKEREYVALVKKAEALIDKIPQEKFQMLLKLKYLSHCSWRTISDQLGYKDIKSAHRCHGYALIELQKVM